MQTQRSGSDAPLVDGKQYGRLLRAARIVAGFDRVEDAAHAVQEMTGVHLTARSLYALERGEQRPTVEVFFAVLMTYRPPGATRFFMGALRDDLQNYLVESARGG